MDVKILVFLVCLTGLASAGDRSEDCNVTFLAETERNRIVLSNYMVSDLDTFTAGMEGLTSSCELHEIWTENVDRIIEDCRYSTGVETFRVETYTQTREVYDYVCSNQERFHMHKECLGDRGVQRELNACFEEFVTEVNKTLGREEPISNIHDTGCDSIQDYLDCVENVTIRECNRTAAEFLDDYIRAQVKPYMDAWKCRFDRSWGWIIIVGVLLAVAAVVAFVWVALFLTCRFCCDCEICACCCPATDRDRYDNEDIED